MSEQENPGKVAGMTPEDFEDIDDDGTVADPYQGIETYWCPLEMVGETDTFLRVVGDNGGTNVEIRVPLQNMRDNGWTPPKESIAERCGMKEHVERLETTNAALLAACECWAALEKYDESGNGFTRADLEAVLVPRRVVLVTRHSAWMAVENMRDEAIALAQAGQHSTRGEGN